MPATVLSRSLAIASLLFCLGCGKPQAPAGAPAAPGTSSPSQPAATTASVETGTVKIEFDMPIDPQAVVTIGSSEYSPKDLEQELKLPEG